MTENSTSPVILPEPPTPPTPSKFPGAVARAVGGVPGTVIAIVTALTAGIQAYQNYQESQAVSRATYEALKTAIERHDVQINSVLRGQQEMRSWMSDLAERLDKRSAERSAIPKVTPQAPVDVAAPPLPADVVVPTPVLPSFDQLK